MYMSGRITKYCTVFECVLLKNTVHDEAGVGPAQGYFYKCGWKTPTFKIVSLKTTVQDETGVDPAEGYFFKCVFYSTPS